MGRWAKGADQVTALIEAHHMQQVVSEPDTVDALLVSARRHIASARLTMEQDPEAAYSLAYDAARKSATALLNHQGLRPTTAGGHLAVPAVGDAGCAGGRERGCRGLRHVRRVRPR